MSMGPDDLTRHSRSTRTRPSWLSHAAPRVVEWPRQPAPQRGAGNDRSAGANWPDEPSPPAWVGRGNGAGGAGAHSRLRTLVKITAVFAAMLVIGPVAFYLFLDFKLHRVDLTAADSGRVAGSAGQNWLITGSDSRQGLTARQERQYVTGHDTGGQRSDTIMVLHVPDNGTPATLVSLPRDSYVSIPGYGKTKLNAAFSYGGPQLLAETVQNATGLRIDHYMGIGFGGLVRVVNAVGGVPVCIKSAVHDRSSGLNLTPGCHLLNGGQALAYVRDRHSFSGGDLQRVQDQRVFMRKLLYKATSPAVYTNPIAALRTAVDATSSLTVDRGTHLYQLARIAFALRHPQTTTVPTAGGKVTPDGSALVWNWTEARRLFGALAHDRPVPANLLTGSAAA
jgi:LCP family protein required for cell wall assembly